MAWTERNIQMSHVLRGEKGSDGGSLEPLNRPSAALHRSTGPAPNRSRTEMSNRSILSDPLTGADIADITLDDAFLSDDATSSDVTLCSVHRSDRSATDRGRSHDLQTSSVFANLLENNTHHLRAPTLSSSPHRTESNYRLLSESTSGQARPSTRTTTVQSNQSTGNNKSTLTPKTHPRLSLKNENENVRFEKNIVYHDNSCSFYSLDELDAMRGRCRLASSDDVITSQPAARSLNRCPLRNNNDYFDFPLNVLDPEKNSRPTAGGVSVVVTSNEGTSLRDHGYGTPETSIICQKCRLCRGLCCARKQTTLPSTYFGRQEVSAKCAIDWCTCMLCATVVLRCIPQPPRDEVEDEKEFRSLPCSSCCAHPSDYQLWCGCMRWTAVSLMCLPCLPCLLAYWPLRGLERACAKYCCHRKRARGCRCEEERLGGVSESLTDRGWFSLDSTEDVDSSLRRENMDSSRRDNMDSLRTNNMDSFRT